VETFNHILQYEEDLIKHSENIDLSIGEMHLLETVGKNNNNGKTISDLAQAHNVTLPSMTIAVNKLVRLIAFISIFTVGWSMRSLMR
jgi:DNA-binding MarR family transcriptional regulator